MIANSLRKDLLCTGTTVMISSVATTSRNILLEGWYYWEGEGYYCWGVLLLGVLGTFNFTIYPVTSYLRQFCPKYNFGLPQVGSDRVNSHYVSNNRRGKSRE